MLISGTELLSAYSANRAVEKVANASKSSSYYQDESPERTKNSDFARVFSNAQSVLQNRDRKLRRFRESDDYEELQKIQPEEAPSWVETITHVSEWEPSRRARPMDLLAKTGW